MNYVLCIFQSQNSQGTVVAEATSTYEDLGQVQDQLRRVGLRTAGARGPQQTQSFWGHGRHLNSFKGHASDQRVCPVNDVSDAFVPRADTSLLTTHCWENVTFCYFTEVNVITVGERMKQCCIVWRVLCPFTSGAPRWPRCHPSL